MEWVVREKRSFLNMILGAISNTEKYELSVPSDVISRTELMCLYISEEIDEFIGINDILYLLYKDFINYSIKNPLPDRILKEATSKGIVKKEVEEKEEDEYIKIVCDGVEYIEKVNNFEKKSKKKRVEDLNVSKTVYVKLAKREAEKGIIILNELYVTKGVKVTMEELLRNLWVNFIYDYRNGTNKRAYKSVVKMLKSVDLK